MTLPKFVKDIALEFLRFLVLGIVAHLASGGELTITLIYTISLRIIDKLLHKYGKEEDVDWLIKGITRF